MPFRFASPRGFARLALVGGAVLSGVVVLWHEVPAPWTYAELGPGEPSTTASVGPLLWIHRALPLWPLAWRVDLLAVLALSLVATLVGWLMARAPFDRGQTLAILAAPALVSAALLPRFRLEPAALGMELLACAPPLLALGLFVRSRPKQHAALVIATASLGVAFEPHTGIVNVAIAGGCVLIGASLPLADALRAVALGTLPALVAGCVVGFGAWPTFALAEGIALSAWPPWLLALGGSSLATLGVTLRNRLAAIVLLAIVAGQWVTVDGAPLAPETSTALVFALASAVWVTTVARLGHHRWLQHGLGTAVCAVLLVMALRPLERRGHAVADDRPLGTLRRVYDRGLVAPGDAVFAYGPYFALAKQAAIYEGWRPDVDIVDASTLDPADFLNLTMRWDAIGRRVLSDSFDGGGNWDPSWIVDSGPLFWFVGRGSIPDPEFTDLSRFEPVTGQVDPRTEHAWADLQIERSRFRRRLGEVEAALQALPMTAQRRRSLLTRLQLARSVRPTPTAASELGSKAGPSDPPQARIIAESADLLYAYGEHARATELFIEAADEGSSQALAALARWQFRAGQEAQAQTTVGWLATEVEARRRAIELGHWLLDRHRDADAQSLLRLMRNTPERLVPAELGLRLRALVTEPAATMSARSQQRVEGGS